MAMNRNYRIAFLGGTRRGYLLLQHLLVQRTDNICCIYGMLEDAHETEKYSPQIEDLSGTFRKPCRLRKKLTDEDVADIIAAAPDIVLIAGWRTLVPADLYRYPRYGAWAAHDSLLPEYRGFAPLNWAMINGESKTGVTLFKVDNGMDTGPVIGSREVPIRRGDSAAVVFEQVIEATIEVVFDALGQLERGTLRFTPQDESRASYTCPRIPDDGCVEWNRTALEIERLINGLSPPYPCAYSFYKGTMFKIVSCEVPESQVLYVGCIPGRPVRILKDRGVEILTGRGTIIIKDIITGDGKRVTADSLIRSVRTNVGLSLMDMYHFMKDSMER